MARELSPERYHVLREKGTEPPFTGAYNALRRPTGCTAAPRCGAELFSSDTKFESGTRLAELHGAAAAETWS